MTWWARFRVGLASLAGPSIVFTACVPTSGGGGGATAAPSTSAATTTKAPATDSGSATAAIDAGAASAEMAVPEGKATWKTVPKEENGFYVVLDGLCSKLGFGRVGKDVVVHYGGTSMYSNERSGLASFIALREHGLESIGDPLIASPTGIAGKSFEDFWIADSTGSRSSEGAVLHRRVGTTWKTYVKDQTNLHAWLDGGIIGTGGMNAPDGVLWVEESKTKPPIAMTSDLMRGFAFSAFPTGEVVVIGKLAADDVKAPYVARTWSPKSPLKHHNLSMLGADGWPTLVETAPDEVYAWMNERIVRWDGTKWTLLGSAKAKIKSASRAAPDELWITTETGNVEKTSPGSKGLSAVSIPEPIAVIDGVERGAVWAVAQSGKAYKRDSDAWKEMKLPSPAFSYGTAPAFKAKNVMVIAPDDVLLLGMYWERGLGWKEQELHQALVRTKAPKETLRCNEPDPENNNIEIGRGFQSWPPTLTATTGPSCATPFVVLARKSKALKTPPHDWPKIRAGLKGHTELGEVKLVELKSGDRTFVGTKAKDFPSAKKIAELAAAKDRLRPEIVCGEPSDVLRTIAIDLTTGDAIP